MKFKRVPRSVALALALLAVATLVAVAETVYVIRTAAPMYKDKDDLDPDDATTLKHGDKVERLSKEGRWSKVKNEKGDVGYVLTKNVSKKRPKGEKTEVGWLARALGAGGKSSRTTNPGTAGAEGLGEVGREYARQHNMDESRKLFEAIQEERTVDPKALLKFQKAGKLGDFAKTGGGK